MKLLIDGYNLLKLIKAAHISDSERATFINALARYSTERQLNLLVIFDGGISTWPQKETVTKLTHVVYPGRGISADSYIKEYIEKNRQQDMLLVSTDRHLNRYAAQFGIPSLDAADFLQFVRLEQQERSVGQKKAGTDRGQLVKFEWEEDEDLAEVDALMRSIGQAHVQKKINYLKNSAATERQRMEMLSKKERILKKKLDKL